MSTIKTFATALGATLLATGIGLASAQATDPAQPRQVTPQPAATQDPASSRFHWERPLMSEPPAAGGTLAPKADRN